MILEDLYEGKNREEAYREAQQFIREYDGIPSETLGEAMRTVREYENGRK